MPRPPQGANAAHSAAEFRSARRSQLLNLLSERDLAALPGLELLTLESRHLVFDVNVPIEYAYFPLDCVISIVGVMSDGSAVESATVGNEGVVGIPLFLGTDRSSQQAFCQVPGDTARIPGSAFRKLLETSVPFRTTVARYTQALFTQVSQTSACNRLHAVRPRAARWLLQTHDRVGRDDFNLTQLFLAQMLGVRRATVTEVAGELQKAGLIRYSYGEITIIDRVGLETVACECYRIIDSEFARLLTGRKTPNPLDRLTASSGGVSLVGDADGGDVA